MRSVLDDHGFLEADLVLIDEPTLGFMREHLAAKRWLYRITDLYADLPDAKKSIESLEDHIAGFVDGFIAASQPIADMVLRRWGERAEVLENGVAFDHFHTAQDEPEAYRDLQRPRAVYVGSLDKRFSWESLALAAAGNPETQFVLIGPSSEHPPLPPNVTWIGPVSYDRLPAFLQHADVGLLPLEQGASNPGRSPMKLYEYAACGLPVVATATAELARRDHAFVFLANSAREFSDQTRSALAARHDVRRAAIDQARARSWEHIADRILGELASGPVAQERGA